jgi:hypothetical protein
MKRLFCGETLKTVLKKTPDAETLFFADDAELCSEEILKDIKIDPVVDVTKMIEGDPAPFFPTIKAMRIGVSGNKRRYSMENLEQVKKQLPLYGYLGHIKEKDRDSEFRNPVTVWIGGTIHGEWLYMKGYVPPEEDNLRKKIALSLKVGKPMPVSILGFMQLKPQGEIHDVLNIQALSVDWANDKMEGIPGAQVTTVSSEQKSNQEDTMTREEIIAALSLADIKKERPDLVTTLQSEMQESDEEKKKRDEEKKKTETLEKENVDLKKKILDTHRVVLLAEIKDENVRALADGLLTGETTEKLDENWKLVKEKLGKIEKPGMPIITGAAEGKKPGSEFVNEDLL